MDEKQTVKNNYIELKKTEILEIKSRTGEMKKYGAWIVKEFRHRRLHWTSHLNSRNYTECGIEKQKGRKTCKGHGE